MDEQRLVEARTLVAWYSFYGASRDIVEDCRSLGGQRQRSLHPYQSLTKATFLLK
jgi:hypothetical protein